MPRITTPKARLHLHAPADFATLQRQSADLIPIFHWLEDGILPTENKLAASLMNEMYQIDENNVLYRLYTPTKRNVHSLRPSVSQLVIPQVMREDVLKQAHNDTFHFRLEEMYHKLCQAVYWPGMYRDIQQFLAKCEPCARSSQRLPPPVRLQHPDMTKPLETLVIDHLTMPTTVHPLTRQSVSYILTMADRAICFTALCPVADTTAKSTALPILHNWIPHYGLPIWVNTDLGPAYTSKIFHELCLLLGYILI